MQRFIEYRKMFSQLKLSSLNGAEMFSYEEYFLLERNKGRRFNDQSDTKKLSTFQVTLRFRFNAAKKINNIFFNLK